MEIEILQLSEGAKKAKGIAVIIDVFRAFTTECMAFSRGCKRIYPIADVSDALAMKANNVDFLLAGERKGKKMPGFDFGNSPFELSTVDLNNKCLIHTTSAGTQGISAAKTASRVLVAGLCNSSATARYIAQSGIDNVSLVCMGFADKHPTDEDTFCAEYIKSLLTGARFDKALVVEALKQGTGARFFEPKNALFSPPQDFYLATEFDAYSFALPVDYDAQDRAYIEPYYLD